VPFAAGPESMIRRAIISGWCVAALVVPGRVAHCLLIARYGRRP
jgi:hypothetical protein